MFWEDFTCLDISQCMLNKTILHVAAKNIESDISECLGHFLSLGIKVHLILILRQLHMVMRIHFLEVTGNICARVFFSFLGKHMVWKAFEHDTHVN